MPIFKCKMCGGDIQLAEDKTFGTCEYCGSTMTLPRVSDEQRAAAFNRGNHFRRAGEFDKALGVYEHIVADDDTDAEAHWCCALCRFGIEYVEDPATYEWLPTCHRASFDSFLEDVDYLAALEHSDGITRRQYQKDAAKIAEVQRGILAASQNTEPYDVFISYKELDGNGERTRDSILAQEIYYRLTEKGWRVFFSRISLEDVPGTQYEPYIFAALNSAKVMVVVGTSAENLNAVWVKNEWSRFLAMMRKDRSKLLIPCYQGMDPYDLPEQLSVLMSYDMGKIGFIQDLIRGVDKVLGAEKKEEVVKETVVVQQTGGPNVTALLKRGQQALEDGDWDKAKDFFDQVLSMDAENAEAFFGLFLTETKSTDENAYISKVCGQQGESEILYVPLAKDRIEAVVKRCAIKDYLSETEIRELFKFDLRYSSTYKDQRKISEREKAAFNANRSLTRAFQYAKGETANRLNVFKTALFTKLDANAEKAKEAEENARKEKQNAYVSFLSEAESTSEKKHREAEDRKEENYQNALESFKQAKTITDYQSVKDSFLALMPYKDSGEMIKRCDVEVSKIEKACVEQGLREHAIRKRRFVLTCMLAVIFAVVAFFTYTKFVVPANNYKVAKALFVAGQYEQAYTALSKLKGYRDVDYLLQNDENLVAVAARIAPFKTVGSTVSFGTYEQDNNTSNGEEAIEWIVLAAEEDKSLLISKYALDCSEYDANWTDSKWETCSLRWWLNGWFITSAFSDEEEAMIIPATVTADKNTYFDTGISYSTTDRIFLLNTMEVNEYFNTAEARECAPTKFAIAQGAKTSETNKVNDEATCSWWLRSRFSLTGDSTNVSYAAYVGDDGAYMALGVGGAFIAVRPALWIQIG